MNQLNSDLQTRTAAPLVACNTSPSTGAARLVVVIREAEEEALLAGRIQELAESRGLAPLLVGVVPDAAKEAELRRRLVTIAAFLKESKAHAGLTFQQAAMVSAPQIQIERGRDWINKVRALVRPNDTLACYSEDAAGLLERPLSDILSCGLNMPVYTFGGLRPERPGHHYLSHAASWLGSLASIVGFLILQARIVIGVQGWAQSALLLVALLAEVGVVWFVNSVTGQI